jgi:hypothetical protein
MRIDLPLSTNVHIETSGCQSIRVEMSDDLGLPFCVIELSLDQAMAIARHIAINKQPSELTKSGWELK